MNITVINGTEKRGVTYRLKEIFLSAFRGKASITEYALPRDCPAFCSGCTSCIIKGENTCKDAEKIGEIEKSLLEADLIVMTSPAYVFHATGAMKAFLDHFAYRWDAAPSRARDVRKTGGRYHAMLRRGGKVGGEGHKAQLILVGNFRDRRIHRGVNGRRRLGKAVRKEKSAAYGKGQKTFP